MTLISKLVGFQIGQKKVGFGNKMLRNDNLFLHNSKLNFCNGIKIIITIIMLIMILVIIS